MKKKARKIYTNRKQRTDKDKEVEYLEEEEGESDRIVEIVLEKNKQRTLRYT